MKKSKRPSLPPFQQAVGIEFGNGSKESIWLLGHVGRRSTTLASQRNGSRPLSLAVPSEVWMAAARRPARSEPAKSHADTKELALYHATLSTLFSPCRQLTHAHKQLIGDALIKLGTYSKND